MSEIRTVIPEEIDAYLEAMVRTGPFASKAELVRAALVSYAQETGPLAQGFDKELIFSPDGRLYQVEYARESSRRGLPVAGLLYDGGVLITASYTPTTGVPAVNVRNEGKVLSPNPSVLLAGSGLVADFRFVRSELKGFKGTTAEEWVDLLALLFWRFTSERGRRPLGTTLLLGTSFGQKPRLFFIDASGAVMEGDGFLMGNLPEGVRDRLAKGYRKGPRKEAEKLAEELLGAPGLTLSHHALP
jgi:20S proteasome alpha/beta subunit